MGGKSSAPSAPDPYQSAGAQAYYGEQAAAYTKGLNAMNTVGPSGSTQQVFSGYDPATGAPQYTTVSQLSPQQLAIYNEQQANQIRSGQTAGDVAQQAATTLARPLPTNPQAPTLQTAIDTSQIPGIPGASDLAGFTKQAQDAAYAGQTQYLDPQFSQEQEQLDAQLRNSGAQPGSAAYDNAMKLFTNQKQQAYQSAAEGAIGQGLQEQQALYGEGANTQQQLFTQAAAEEEAANAAREQQYGGQVSQLENQIALNQVPLNEYNSLESGVNANLPSFGLGGSGAQAGVSAPDIMSAFNNQYAGQLAQYNAGVASQNADIGALSTVAAAYLLAT